MTESPASSLAEPTTEPVPGRRLGAVALHPVLLAIHPALALWSANVDEVLPSEVWPALWVPAVIALVAWGLATLALGTARRGAVAASTLITVALWAGRLWFGPSLLVVAALALLAGVAAGAVVRNLTRPTSLGITAVVNVLALVLVAFTVPNIASAEWARRGASVPEGIDVAVPAGDAEAGGLPDIFYIIPDRYPREDSLEEFFAYDNSAWVDALEERGFQVADRAVANYPSTGMSLSSTWNLAPIDQLVTTPPENPKDWAPAYALLRDHALGRNLVRAGYNYTHMGTWWSPTSIVNSATQNLRLDGTSEFVSVFQQQLGGRGGTAAKGDEDDALADMKWYERSPLHTLFQWQELKRMADEQYESRDQPRFVLAHITVPHEPYVFEADGSPVTQETAWSRTREDNFIRQVQYVNNEIDDFLDRLLDGPRDQWPVVVIQSDEGPHPAGKKDASYDWLEVSVDERREKLQIFSAILLPDRYDLELPEDLRSINTWRLLLDELLGTNLGTVDAPVYIYSPKAIYDVVDVTDQITRGEPDVDN